MLDSEREQVERIQVIWAARRQVAGRFLGMTVVLGIIAYVVWRPLSEPLASMWRTVPESVARDVMVNTIAGLVLVVIAGLVTFVWAGFSNPAAKAAFTSTNVLRLRTWWQRRKQLRQLRNNVKESLQTMPAGLSQLDTACLTAITQWIQNENAEFLDVHGRLTKARERVNERAQSIGGLIATISPWVTNLPRRLLERSQSIRQEAIAEHMATIRDAADSVEALRSKIVRIAENAEVSVP